MFETGQYMIPEAQFLSLKKKRGWTQIDYQSRHYNIKQKDEGT
jgi:hypothetical protein